MGGILRASVAIDTEKVYAYGLDLLLHKPFRSTLVQVGVLRAYPRLPEVLEQPA